VADVLVVVEQREGLVTGPSKEAASVGARVAASLGARVRALVLGGPGVSSRCGELGAQGVADVIALEHDALVEYHPEAYSSLVEAHAREGAYGVILLPATTSGKDLAPRVAALLDVPLATDATALTVEGGRLVITRPVYAGKAFAEVETDAAPVVVTLRPNAFPAASGADGEARVNVAHPQLDPAAWKVRVVERRQAEKGVTDVAEATVIVSGGRGMKDPSHWHVLEGLRDALGSGVALGASRAVVDAGWRPHGEQVGQTGKTVSPKLYIAVGISGAVQHLAGMRTAKTIVAINKDPDAPIFGVADYGIVGDLFDVVPRLSEEIRALKARS